MSSDQTPLDEEILAFYSVGLEAGRLELPYFQWERIRTLDLMDRFLPPAPAVILDVGGGAGAYAFGLAEKGYIVDLVDPVPLHIEQAKRRAAAHGRAPRSFLVGDARSLPADDASVDAVLLLGPLYHLTELVHRLTAIREAQRVLRPGGVLMAVAISRFASALDGLSRGLVRDPQFIRIVERDLGTGQHRNQTGNPEYFTTAFFHRPEEFKEELIQGGFETAKLYAIEGPVWTIPELTTSEQQDAIMAILRELECEATLIGSSAHMMGIAKKR